MDPVVTESIDAGPEVDLTPREQPPVGAQTGRTGRRWVGILLVVAVVAGIGFVLYRGLSNATVFFYNADVAVQKRAETGDRRIRIQGNVVKESIVKLDHGVRFDVKFNGVVVGVDNSSDPPDLFGPTIPVVIEGKWNGERFAGDKILVKHDEKYDEKNQDRIDCAAADAASESISGSGAGSGTATATPCPSVP